MAEINRVNTEGLSENTIIGSTDVKALYPSLDIEFTIEKICELFQESVMKIDGIDYEEMGLCLMETTYNHY